MLSENSQRGFSLIELMLALVIVSVLLGLALPNYRVWVQNQQARAAAESVLNGIQLSRSEAVKRNGTVRFVLCGPGGGGTAAWEVLAASAGAPAPGVSQACGALSTAAVDEERVQEHSSDEGTGLALIAILPAGSDTLTFSSLGRVIPNADGSDPITSVAVTTASGDRGLNILVGPGGNARMCDPHIVAATDPRRCN